MSEAKRPLGGPALAELARARILPILTVDEPGTAVAIGTARSPAASPRWR